MNIESDYVSFEIAKLLKQKGFTTGESTEYVSGYYWEDDEGPADINPPKEFYMQEEDWKRGDYYLRPQFWQVMKWFRSKNISISIITGNNSEGFIYFGQIAFVDKEDVFRINTLKMDDYEKIEKMGLVWNKVFETYEQAENKSILYVLKNLL